MQVLGWIHRRPLMMYPVDTVSKFNSTILALARSRTYESVSFRSQRRPTDTLTHPSPNTYLVRMNKTPSIQRSQLLPRPAMYAPCHRRRNADVFRVQEGLAPAISPVVGGVVLPQRDVPLRGFHPHRLVCPRPLLLHDETVSARVREKSHTGADQEVAPSRNMSREGCYTQYMFVDTSRKVEGHRVYLYEYNYGNGNRNRHRNRYRKRNRKRRVIRYRSSNLFV